MPKLLDSGSVVPSQTPMSRMFRLMFCPGGHALANFFLLFFRRMQVLLTFLHMRNNFVPIELHLLLKLELIQPSRVHPTNELINVIWTVIVAPLPGVEDAGRALLKFLTLWYSHVELRHVLALPFVL